MAGFYQCVDCKYGVDSYQAIKNTYDWILKAAQKLGLNKLKVAEQFTFKIGDILCVAENITEFIEHAYGSENFELINFHINIYNENKNIVSVIYLLNLKVYTDDKVSLEKFVNLLNTTTLDEVEINDTISITYIEKQNSGIIIQGDNNAVANDHSSVITSAGKLKSSKVKQWLNAIGQNLLANGIWYLLCLVGGALITSLITKG